MIVGYTLNNRNRYKCNYCNHSTYKTTGGILNHVVSNHKLELERDKAIQRAEYAEKAKAELSRQLAEATKPAPKEEDKKYWHHGVFCTACRIAYRSVGIPFGQTIESTPHSNCGTRSLVPVDEVVY